MGFRGSRGVYHDGLRVSTPRNDGDSEVMLIQRCGNTEKKEPMQSELHRAHNCCNFKSGCNGHSVYDEYDTGVSILLRCSCPCSCLYIIEPQTPRASDMPLK